MKYFYYLFCIINMPREARIVGGNVAIFDDAELIPQFVHGWPNCIQAIIVGDWITMRFSNGTGCFLLSKLEINNVLPNNLQMLDPHDGTYNVAYRGAGEHYYLLEKNSIYYCDINTWDLYNENGEKIEPNYPHQSVIPPRLFVHIPHGGIFINAESTVDEYCDFPMRGFDLARRIDSYVHYIKYCADCPRYNTMKNLENNISLYLLDDTVYYATVINDKAYFRHGNIIRELTAELFDSEEFHNVVTITEQYRPSTQPTQIGRFIVWVKEAELPYFNDSTNYDLYYGLRYGVEYMFAIRYDWVPIKVEFTSVM